MIFENVFVFQEDGYCDDATNVEVCDWDGGDCCGPLTLKEYCNECLCLDPNFGGNKDIDSQSMQIKFHDYYNHLVNLETSTGVTETIGTTAFSCTILARVISTNQWNVYLFQNQELQLE